MIVSKGGCKRNYKRKKTRRKQSAAITSSHSIVKSAKLLIHVRNLFNVVRFQIQGSEIIYDLIDIVRPTDKSYIILESLNQLKDNNNIKAIHVVELTGQKTTIGRGHEADMRVNDISVSRSHAVISYDNGKISIRDLKSKFGTLVLIKRPLTIIDKRIHLQIGRTYIDGGLLSFTDYEKLKRQR